MTSLPLTAKPESVTIPPSSNKGFHAEDQCLSGKLKGEQNNGKNLPTRSVY